MSSFIFLRGDLCLVLGRIRIWTLSLYESMIRPAFRRPHNSCMEHVFRILAARDDVIQHVPIFGVRMLPGSLDHAQRRVREDEGYCR